MAFPTSVRTLHIVGVFFLLSALASHSSAQALAVPKRYTCYHVKEGPKIDGQLDEAAWNEAAWTDLFIDIEGDKKPKPAMSTRAKMLWDDQYLYIAAVLEEKDIWAYQSVKDQIVFYENDFEVFIDPDGDNLNYFEMEVNAINNTFDLFLPKPYRSKGKPDHDYDMNGFLSAVEIKGTLNDPSDRDSSWTVEMAIPFDDLKYGDFVTPNPKDGTVWRLNFSRVNWQTDIKNGKYERKKDPKTGKLIPEYNWVWSPQGVIDMHRPDKWGYLEFAKRD
ncbi:carbohydrate-binding family 9-like protein [Olivibacter sp. XZL3]|uniref:carbohydrate-binding family 9-like protein n=1 Tax=Olivibacter sp. XZL3 TaxID=1735116 RepID=UPI001065EFDD|nr:carbohydrate-binding family 9-like protein [Olivibacter sp. XZL3]